MRLAQNAVVGGRLPRVDALMKATGEAIFGTDVRLKGMLFGKLLTSPYSHARIAKVDASKAARAAGVKAVLSGRDVPNRRYGRGSICDMRVLPTDKVRYKGEVVAAIAAESEEAAAEALDLIVVEYEELSSVHDPLEAIRPGAPLIHEAIKVAIDEPDMASRPNISDHSRFVLGDVDQGFGSSAHIFEDSFKTQMVHQGHIEPHAALAQVGHSGKITIWTTSHAPFGVRSDLASIFGLPMSAIRVVGTCVGGSFGGKGYILLEPICALLALKTLRPVKITMSREDEFTFSTPRHSSLITIKSGISRDHKIIARQVKVFFDTGAFASFKVGKTLGGSPKAAGPYNIPNVKIDAYCIYTNKIPGGHCRAPGDPQVAFAFESHMDAIARELSIDPLEFRLMNALDRGDAQIGGGTYGKVGLKEAIKSVRPYMGARPPAGGAMVGRGMGCALRPTGGGQSSACCKVNEDGTVVLSTGTIDIGTGSSTILAQIAAHELGLGPGSIVMVTADTELTPYDSGSGGNRATFVSGSAVRSAAIRVRERLAAVAAELLEANPQDLIFSQGKVYVKGYEAKTIAMAELAKMCQVKKGGPVLDFGTFSSLNPESPTFTAQVAQVEVDPETGVVRLIGYAAALDVGTALNPDNVEGQIAGAVAQGAGFGLWEEICFEEGAAINRTLLDYKMPTALDIPAIVPIIVEGYTGPGPYGAKAAGELPTAPVAAAIANAIFDASGARLRELPLTPERVLRGLREKASALRIFEQDKKGQRAFR